MHIHIHLFTYLVLNHLPSACYRGAGKLVDGLYDALFFISSNNI